MKLQSLTIESLRSAVQQGAAAIRARSRLQPIGGPGDKLFPPTFGDSMKVDLGNGITRETKYAVERRRIDGEDRMCVLLDSVASQANRIEEALQTAWDDGRLAFPMVRVDFRGATHADPTLDLSCMGGDGFLTALEVPHRLADALVRDSMKGDLLFRATPEGRAFTEASPHNATPLYKLCPTALIMGMWDSTGPKGGMGAKFQRALVSEVVGIGVAFGAKTGSRLDPAGIVTAAGPIYQARDETQGWTLDEAQAKVEKGKAALFKGRKESEKPGRPSQVNHGNVTPSIDSLAGGVTVDYAEQITVFSLPALRRLHFPKDIKGETVPRDKRLALEEAARLNLAALALAGVALQQEEGFDLRSRCALVPMEPLTFEIVGRDGAVSEGFSLRANEALDLVAKASEAAAKVGMEWDSTPLDLVPAPKLIALIQESRRLAAGGEELVD